MFKIMAESYNKSLRKWILLAPLLKFLVSVEL